MIFQISDLSFSIESAILDAFIDEEKNVMNWGIEIQSQGNNWHPQAYSEVLLNTAPEELTNWRGISGREITWSSPLNEADEPYGVLYVFGHEPIYNSNIQLNLSADNSLILKWDAYCDIYWDEKYGSNLQLRIETALFFQGILCGRRNKAECEHLVKHFFSLDDFEYTLNKNGVSIMVPKA